MRKAILIVVGIIGLMGIMGGCKNKLEGNDFYVSSEKKWPYVYYEKDIVCNDNPNKIGGYVSFETYMWDEGFPDTIIVEFTVDGKFDSYQKAHRSGLLKDSLGNYYSPKYVVSAYNGDNWVYNFRGEFVEFNADIVDNDTRNYIPTYNP